MSSCPTFHSSVPLQVLSVEASNVGRACKPLDAFESGKVKNRITLQLCTGVQLVVAAAANSLVTIKRLLLLLHLLRSNVTGCPNGNPHLERIVSTALNFSIVNYRVSPLYIQQWFYLDCSLHDITSLELRRSTALSLLRNICLASWDDALCYQLSLDQIHQHAAAAYLPMLWID